MKKGLVYLLLALFFFLFNKPVPAKSFNSAGLSVSPAILELVIKPGETNRQFITVFNITDQALPVRASVEGFKIQEQINPSTLDNFNAASWIQVEPKDFILPAQDSIELEIMVLPPAQAEAGGHYATIYFQVLSAQQLLLSSQMALQSARVGVLALFIVEGDVQKEVSFASLNYRRHQSENLVLFRLPISNLGNVHFLSEGKVLINNFLGQEKTTLIAENRLVLPGTTREIEFAWRPTWFFGLYTAQAFLDSPEGQRIFINRPITVFLFSWQLLTLLLLVFLIVFFASKKNRLILMWQALFSKNPKK